MPPLTPVLASRHRLLFAPSPGRRSTKSSINPLARPPARLRRRLPVLLGTLVSQSADQATRQAAEEQLEKVANENFVRDVPQALSSAAARLSKGLTSADALPLHPFCSPARLASPRRTASSTDRLRRHAHRAARERGRRPQRPQRRRARDQERAHCPSASSALLPPPTPASSARTPAC